MSKHQRVRSVRDYRPWKIAPQRWEQVDWKQKDATLARQLGVSRTLIYVQRKKRGIWMQVAEKRRLQLAALPRGLSMAQVGRQLGLNEKSVGRWVERFEYEAKTRRGIRASREKKFKSFPPGLTYKQIAMRLHVTLRMARKWAIMFGYRARLARPGRYCKGGRYKWPEEAAH